MRVRAKTPTTSTAPRRRTGGSARARPKCTRSTSATTPRTRTPGAGWSCTSPTVALPKPRHTIGPPYPNSAWTTPAAAATSRAPPSPATPRRWPAAAARTRSFRRKAVMAGKAVTSLTTGSENPMLGGGSALPPPAQRRRVRCGQLMIAAAAVVLASCASGGGGTSTAPTRARCKGGSPSTG